MPTLKEVISVIEVIAPPGLADDWDNSGLQIGDTGIAVKTVLVALDPVPEVMDEAAGIRAELVVSHHPLFFRDVRSLELGGGTGAVVSAAVRHGIAVYSAHTSFDRAKVGVSDALATAIGLKNKKPLKEAPGLPAGCGSGRVGDLPRKLRASEIADKLKAALGVERVRLVGDAGMMVGRVAVCGGSGAGFMGDALSAGAGLYVTGDIKYHEALRALDLGLTVIDVGHFASERPAVPLMAGLLSKAFGKKGWRVKVVESRVQVEPWSYL